MTLAVPNSATIEQVVINGDLSNLSPDQKLGYYNSVCASLGLNPLTKPFAYIKLDGKLVLYALRDATDQLRNLHNISVEITSREMIGDIYVVTARATKGGRVDESTGAVSVAGQKSDFLANSMMKAESKAKRRVTLSINGLGFMDETEVAALTGAKVSPVDPATGEILQEPPDGSTMAINPPSRPRPSNRPQRPAPKSSEGKLKQLDQARYDAEGTEVYTAMDVVVYIASNFSERSARDLNDAELDSVIEALLAGQVKAHSTEAEALAAAEPVAAE